MPSPLNKVIVQLESEQTKILTSLFIVIHAVLLLSWGIGTGLEAEKYISSADRLLSGQGFSENKYYFYLPVILLITFTKLVHLPLIFVVIIQIALSGFSQFLFNRIIGQIAGKPVAFIGSLLLLLMIPYQQWNIFLYSDSIFISLSLLFTCTLYYCRVKKTMLWECASILLLVTLVFSRPTGMLLIIPYLMFRASCIRGWKRQLGFASFCLISLLLAILGVNYIYRNGSDMDILRPYLEEHIICFVPTRTNQAPIPFTRSDNPVEDLFRYAVAYPYEFLRMVGLRLLSFFKLSRPYYSWVNNLYLTFISGLIYLFAMVGLKKIRYCFGPFYLYAGLFLITYPLLISLQCDDWHSRFTMIVFPFLTVLAATGLVKTLAPAPNSNN